MPSVGDRQAVFGRKSNPAILAEKLVQHLAMDVVDVEARIDGAEHPFQRAAPIFIGESMPIALDPAPGTALGEHGDETALPVEDRAAAVEGQHLDRLHLTSLQPARTRAAGTMKLPAISRSRSSSLVCRASRNAWIAAPAALLFQSQSPSWRLDGQAAPAAAASRQ